jgi:hypothetical protein
MPRGQQMRVRSPGRNRKMTAFGAWRYGHGSLLYHTQPRKTAWGFRILLQKLVRRARRTGRRIILVMDQGNPHHAKAIHHDLQVVKEHVEVFWLPHYSPELNLIEILWRHLKRSRMANMLFRSFRRFATHLDELLSDFAMQPDLTLRLITPNCRMANRKNLLLGT